MVTINVDAIKTVGLHTQTTTEFADNAYTAMNTLINNIRHGHYNEYTIEVVGITVDGYECTFTINKWNAMLTVTDSNWDSSYTKASVIDMRYFRDNFDIQTIINSDLDDLKA